MNILIETPTWLGDSVMTTPAIENIVEKYPEAKITLFGSYISIETLKLHPNVIKSVVDESKKRGNRFLNLKRIAKNLGSFDIAISFRSSIATKFFFFFIDAKEKYIFKREGKTPIHQVIRYNQFVNRAFKMDSIPKTLKLYHEKVEFFKPTFGINPGASYGNAKRWYPREFAKVAIRLADTYHIIIFGSPNEVDIAEDIERELISAGIENYTNMAGKTTIKELIEHIAGLKLFITNDSGPMHIAAAYQIPTISIFGPTSPDETNQWRNPKSIIIKKDLDCMPCMKRTCPLKHHNCMKQITYSDVMMEIYRII